MSKPKPGDRVRVETSYEGTVAALTAPEGYVNIQRESTDRIWMHSLDQVTVIRSPLAVGDLVRDYEDLDDMRDGSVLLYRGRESGRGLAAQKRDGEWKLVGGMSHSHVLGEYLLDARVLHIGGES